MQIVNPSFEFVSLIDGRDILRRIELSGRTCYKSESRITEDSAIRFVRGIIKSGHESVLEHQSLSVRVTCDRGVSHEIVRHRLASYSQESTRYCNYNTKGIVFVSPCFMNIPEGDYDINEIDSIIASSDWSNEEICWIHAMRWAEHYYNELIGYGMTPQEARSVLPNSLKTEIVITMNLREWRHFFKLRALGTAGKPHPQMVEIAMPMLIEFNKRIPVVFADLIECVDG